jgi:hypothetical protein
MALDDHGAQFVTTPVGRQWHSLTYHAGNLRPNSDRDTLEI